MAPGACLSLTLAVLLSTTVDHVASKGSLVVVSYTGNEMCNVKDEPCKRDADCCDDGDVPILECLDDKCSSCGPPKTRCMSNVDCCNVLSCGLSGLCCGHPGSPCMEDIGCCQSPSHAYVCKKTKTKLPGQAKQCRRAKGHEKPDLSKKIELSQMPYKSQKDGAESGGDRKRKRRRRRK